MPQQSVFFDERTLSNHVQVLKVYDASYAHSCFEEMNEEALSFLAKSLGVGAPDQITEPEFSLTWEDLMAEAREDWNLFSFFIVLKGEGGGARPVYVSPDWPSAEAFAKLCLVGM